METALTPIEVAHMLKISKGTVYQMVKRGDIGSYRVGNKVRIDTDDLEKYININMKSQSDKQYDKHDKDYKNCDNEGALVCQREEMKKKHDFVICGQDIMLDVLARYLHRHPSGVQAIRTYLGSYNGLYELYHSKVQVATVNLWDGDTGQYNVPYVKRMLPGVPVVIVHLAKIMQCIYVQKSNPKGIKSLNDLKRPDITMVNREVGSGTRILLDEHLRKLGINTKNLQGYEREFISDLTVANTVARCGADIGIGSKKVINQVKGIDFIPIQYASYELVIKKEHIHKPKFQAVLDILRSEEFKLELEGIGGYDLSNLGEIK